MQDNHHHVSSAELRGPFLSLRTSETLTTTPHLSLRFSEAQPANLALLSLFFAEGPPPGDPL